MTKITIVTLITCSGGWRPSGEMVKDGGGVVPGVRPLLSIVSKCKKPKTICFAAQSKYEYKIKIL